MLLPDQVDSQLYCKKQWYNKDTLSSQEFASRELKKTDNCFEDDIELCSKARYRDASVKVSSSKNNAKLGLNLEHKEAVSEEFNKIVRGIEGGVNYIFTKILSYYIFIMKQFTEQGGRD